MLKKKKRENEKENKGERCNGVWWELDKSAIDMKTNGKEPRIYRSGCC